MAGVLPGFARTAARQRGRDKSVFLGEKPEWALDFGGDWEIFCVRHRTAKLES